MRFRPVVLLALACASGCAPEADAPRPAVAPRPETPRPAQTTARIEIPLPPRPTARPEAPPVVFDTVEAAPPVAPAPLLPPRPPGPPRTPPPASDPPGPTGSCDVRATEGYCFAYTGTGWTPQTAEDNCDRAPQTTFRPAPCPTDDRIATCTYTRPSDPSREIVYTTYAPSDLSLARLACPGEFRVLE